MIRLGFRCHSTATWIPIGEFPTIGRKLPVIMPSESHVTVDCPTCGISWELTPRESEADTFTCEECNSTFEIRAQTAPRPSTDSTPALSPTWIILYLVATSLCVQLFPNRASVFLELRLALSLAICALLILRGQLREVPRLFFGRWLPRSVISALTFIFLTVLTHVIVDAYFHLRIYPLTWISVRDGIIVAPLNEEPIFRGLFLNILFRSMPRHRWAAVILSAFIFSSVHYSILWISVTGLSLLGLLCGACFAVTESVPVCILCHALWNAFNS